MVAANYALARLETRVHLCGRPQSDDSAGRDSDRVISEHGVDRGYR